MKKISELLSLGVEDLQAHLENDPELGVTTLDQVMEQGLEVGLQQIERCFMPVGEEIMDHPPRPEGLTSALECLAGVEAIQDRLKGQGQGDFRMAAMAMESVCLGLNVREETGERMATSGNLVAAQEALSDRAAELLDVVKDRLVKAADHIKEQFGMVKRSIDKIEDALKDAEAEIAAIEKDTSRFGAVKAEPWCAHLCSIEDGFDEGLKVLPARVTSVLESHAKLAGQASAQFVDWLVQNRDNETMAVFNSLSFDPKGFLLSEQKRFDQTVGVKEPSRGQVFFRSQDLGGGKALYTETVPAKVTGLDALKALSSIRFFLSPYSPKGFQNINLKVTALVGLPTTVWLSCVAPPLGAAAGWGLMEWLRSHQVEGSGKEVTIDPDYLFKCLTPEEMREVISQVRKGISALRDWNEAVIQKPWKNAHFDDLVKRIYEREGDERPNEKYIRTYIGAVVDLMIHFDCGIVEHARDTYLASLKFVIKSAKQYR